MNNFTTVLLYLDWTINNYASYEKVIDIDNHRKSNSLQITHNRLQFFQAGSDFSLKPFIITHPDDFLILLFKFGRIEFFGIVPVHYS